MLIVLELWRTSPGVSEMRISKYDEHGSPRPVCSMMGDTHGLMQAAEVVKAAYTAAGVKWNLKEVVH